VAVFADRGGDEVATGRFPGGGLGEYRGEGEEEGGRGTDPAAPSSGCWDKSEREEVVVPPPPLLLRPMTLLRRLATMLLRAAALLREAH